jgi:glycosyltransferase involved in cell wall biosynthesis
MIDLSYLAPGAWERQYLGQISQFLPETKAIAIHWWGQRRRWLARFPLPKPRLVVPRKVDSETVVIIVSDELYRIPKHIPALAVFKQYVANDDRHSIPFPLGVHAGFPDVPVQPIKDRAIDIGFVGQSYPHRLSFLSRLQNHRELKRYRIHFNCEGGVPITEYARLLNNTKISICLPGYLGPETFRYYESIKSGCIVVSAKMPVNALYQPDPGFQVDDINDVDRLAGLLSSILEQRAEHDFLQQRSLAAWEQRYSPPAVAAAISNAASQSKK